MATYYVDCDVGASGTGLSWAQAKKTIGEGVALAVAAGDVVEISGGTYAEKVTIDTADGGAGNYITFRGSSDVGHDDEVIVSLDPATNYLLNVHRDYIWVEGITLHHVITSAIAYSGLYVDATSDHAVFQELHVKGAYQNQIAGTNLTFARCIFQHMYGTTIVLAAASMGTFSHCFFGNSAGITINSTSTGTWAVSDSIVLGSDASLDTISRTGGGGVLNLDHSLTLPSSVYSTKRLTGVTEGAGNLVLDPRLTSYHADGYIVFAIDDHDLDYAEDVAAILNPLGQKVFFSIDTLAIQSETNWKTRLQAFITAGNEVACHTYSHSSMSVTTAFTVTGTGTTPTVQVDRTNDRIRFNDAENGNQDVVAFRAKTLTAIRAEINAMTGFSAGALTAHLSGNCLGEALSQVVTPAACVTPKTLWLDQTTNGSQGYFKVEMFDPKAWIEAQFPGYTCKTFSPPWSEMVTLAYTAVVAAGYTGGRAVAGTSLSSIIIHQVLLLLATNIVPGDLDANTASVCINAAETPKLTVVLSHNATEMSLARVAAYAAVVAAAIDIDATKTFAEIIDYITTSALWVTANGGLTWTRVYVDTSDYRPLVSSPCIGAAEDGSDIGVYKYEEPPGGAGFIGGGFW